MSLLTLMRFLLRCWLVTRVESSVPVPRLMIPFLYDVMMFWYAQLRSLPSFSTKNLIPQMCTSLSKNKLLIAGCTCLAIGFISALSGIMTSVWAVKEYSDKQGFLKSVTFGLWHFRRCGGFRINGECNKGELQQTDIQYFGAEGLLLSS